MKFILEIVDRYNQTISGLELVDIISEKLGTTIPAELVHPATFSLSQEVELTEEQARECGHYQKCCHQTVWCTIPFKPIPQLVVMEPEESDGERKVCFTLDAELDFQAFWKKWKEAEFNVSIRD
jgi:hypothetical protein